jgi:type I restriction enzyme S subunit
MEDPLSRLPRGWALVQISEVCDLTNGRAFKPKEWSTEGMPIIRIQNLNNNKAEFNYCSFKVDEKYYVNKGDLLFAWSGTPGTSFGAHIWKGDRAVLNQHIFNVIIDENKINKAFLMNLLNQKVGEYVRKAHGTAGLAHITKSKFESSLIPICPFAEQHRIVAKIEELFTKLDAGVEALKKVKAQLKRYRQAVLKYAFEGKLTQEWREANKDKLEPASVLLARIEEDWKKLGQGKFNGPALIDISEATKLPEGWKWVSSATIFSFVTSGSRGWAKYYSDSGPIFIRMGNLNHASIELDLQEIQNVQPPSGTEGTRTRVKANDILISITADIGMVGLVPEKFPEAYINQHVALARPIPSINVKYLAWFLASNANGQRQMSKLQRGATKIGLGLDDILSINIPLPSHSEQDQIADEIEHYFSITDEIEKIAEQTLKQSERLRQAILKSAFEGNLVPQDPTDEPGEKLLERIKAEKAKRESETKGRRKKSNQMELI